MDEQGQAPRQRPPRPDRAKGGRPGRPPRPGGRPPPARGGPPRPGGQRARGAKSTNKRRLTPQQKRQVQHLVEQSHIPFPAAVRVVTGQSTLNEVLQEMLREEKIKNLMASHEFNRALATSIALGRADLDTILLRRRKNETLESNYARSCLEVAQKDGRPLGLALHGHRRVRGRVLSVGKYEFQLLEDGAADPISIHKTQVKYGYDPGAFKDLKKFHTIDNHVKKLSMEPILRVKDRHHFKNLTLQRAMDEGTEIEVVSLEGDVFKGQVTWFGRWEFGMRFKGGVEVTVFRHAVFKVHGIERPTPAKAQAAAPSKTAPAAPGKPAAPPAKGAPPAKPSPSSKAPPPPSKPFRR